VLLGESNLATPTPIVFGQYGARSDRDAARQTGKVASQPGPTLVIDYSTMGGELVVRDYPDDVAPRSYPDWPGYSVYPEERPDTSGLSAAEAERVVEEWRGRRAEQVEDQARVERLQSGPCAREPEAVRSAERKRRRSR
jgi:hypothetical protein